ncbi:MAG TPA: metalloregulator ArsR/SmtB family transcription factor [Symbiobacteriaceae bacterium]|jgi:ArsR family transcriptional regulator
MIIDAKRVSMNPVEIFKALGHPQRYALFLDLMKSGSPSCCDEIAPGESACCVLDLSDRHDLAQSTISHHLRVLVNAGLVRQERRGTYGVYRIDEKTWGAFRVHLTTLNVCRGIGYCIPADLMTED